MANLTELVGKKVLVTTDLQKNVFKKGNIYTVTGTGMCAHGKGVTTAEEGNSFVLVEHNFKVCTAVKPAPLDLKGFLLAIYNNEAVVSVTEDGAVYDEYINFTHLDACLTFNEIENSEFYLAEDWDAYVEALEFDEKQNAVEKLTFAQAVEELAKGKKVISINPKTGEQYDEYYTLSGLEGMALFETGYEWQVVD